MAKLFFNKSIAILFAILLKELVLYQYFAFVDIIHVSVKLN